MLSFRSWAGVIFKAPVPNFGSTYSSSIIGINLFEIGATTFFPIRFLNLLSMGLTQIAVSPKIVSGLVVAIDI